MDIIIFILSFIGIIAGTYFLFRNIRNTGVLFLNLLCIFVSADLFILKYIDLYLWEIYPGLLFINWSFPFIYGPLLYLYYTYYFFPETKLRWFYFIYFLPFFIIFFLNFSIITGTSQNKFNFYNEMKINNLPYLINDSEWIAHSILNALFLVLSFLLIKKELKNYKPIRYFANLLLIFIFPLQAVYVVIFTFTDITFMQNNFFITLLWFIVFFNLILNQVFKKRYTSIS